MKQKQYSIPNVGIVTLPGDYNYGNRLQAYALQTFLENIGAKATHIRPKSNRPIKNVIRNFLVKLNLKTSPFAKIVQAKKCNIKPFSDKYICYSSRKRNFDFLIVGSDQVWNPNYLSSDDYFLRFAPINKRIAYAASFGVATIPKDKEKIFSNYLKGIPYMSVREQQGTKIVKQLTGKKVPVVLDPTMLLPYSCWLELLEKEPFRCPKQKYLFVYSLHDLGKNELLISAYAKKHKLKIYRVMGDEYSDDMRIPSVVEFLHRINNAEAVFTDSFHASVFSILFKTPFVVMKRRDADMSSRIVTLLKTVGMPNNLLSDSQKDIESIISSTDFRETSELIDTQRASGAQFLKSIIRGVER